MCPRRRAEFQPCPDVCAREHPQFLVQWVPVHAAGGRVLGRAHLVDWAFNYIIGRDLLREEPRRLLRDQPRRTGRRDHWRHSRPLPHRPLRCKLLLLQVLLVLPMQQAQPLEAATEGRRCKSWNDSGARRGGAGWRRHGGGAVLAAPPARPPGARGHSLLDMTTCACACVCARASWRLAFHERWQLSLAHVSALN